MAVLTTQNQNQRDTTDLPTPSSRRSPLDLGRSLDEFLQSLGDVLLDITALEVNTMVVEQITADKFIPWEAYRDIYSISQEYFAQKGIHESLRDRYIHLRQGLEQTYTSLISDPTSEFYDPTVLSSTTSDRQIPDAAMAEPRHPVQLPNPLSAANPEDLLQAQQLLHNSRFLRSLRKLGELKSTLDNRNQSLLKQQPELADDHQLDVLPKTGITDMIYAQTVMQLDGDIINRYSQEVLDHPYREVLLQIHQDGVIAGEKQWRGLLNFIIGLVQTSLQQGLVKDRFSRDGTKLNGQR